MKHLRIFATESDYSLYLVSNDFVKPHVAFIEETEDYKYFPYTPIALCDIAYWSGTKVETIKLADYNTSLGPVVGVVVIPEGFAPDGKVRIVGLKSVDSNGNMVDTPQYIMWENNASNIDTPLTNFQRVPVTDNTSYNANGFNAHGYLPSDNFTGVTSFSDRKVRYAKTEYLIPSPYLSSMPNPDYYKKIDGNNVLSDFNGFSNTQTLVGLGNNYEAANAAWKYNDGTNSNLQWYLPAMAELSYLMIRINEINTALTAVGGVGIGLSNAYWSSSEFIGFAAYCLSTGDGYAGGGNKDSAHWIRPFACI